MSGKLTLIHLNNSQSQTTLWLLEELGIDYELKAFERVKQRAPADLKQTHPLGKSPQLITPTGRVIVERSAIALYLIETYDASGKFKIASPPADPEYDAVKEDSIISFGNATIGPLVMLGLVFTQLVKMTPFFLRPLPAGIKAMLDKAFLKAEVELNLGHLDSMLEGREYLMGGPDPTRADFVNIWYIDWAHQGELFDMQPYKNVEAWRSRCINRPAWKSALEKGNGYDMRM